MNMWRVGQNNAKLAISVSNNKPANHSLEYSSDHYRNIVLQAPSSAINMFRRCKITLATSMASAFIYFKDRTHASTSTNNWYLLEVWTFWLFLIVSLLVCYLFMLQWLYCCLSWPGHSEDIFSWLNNFFLKSSPQVLLKLTDKKPGAEIV